MRSATAAAVLALTLGQTGGQSYSGLWIAELAGTTYVRLDLNVTNGALGGRISLGNVQLDGQGEVASATEAPLEFTPIFSVRLRDSTLSSSRKDGNDTDQFEMRLLSDQAAELGFLPTEADLKELADNGVPRPKPVRLKRVAR